MLLIITPVNLLSSSTSTFFWGGGRQGGFWIHVPSCLSYLRAMCFESYVGHSLASEVAVVDIHSLLANAGTAYLYRLSQIPRPFQLILDNHHVSYYITKNKQKHAYGISASCSVVLLRKQV